MPALVAPCQSLKYRKKAAFLWKTNTCVTKTWHNSPQGHSLHSSAVFRSVTARLQQNNLLVTCPVGNMLATSCMFLLNSKSEIIQAKLLKKEELFAAVKRNMYRVSYYWYTRSQHLNLCSMLFMPTRKAGVSKGRQDKNMGLRNIFCNFPSDMGKVGRGWQTGNLWISFIDDFPLHQIQILYYKMTYPCRYLISHLYFPARTWTVASLFSCNNTSLCLWQTFLPVNCQRSWRPVSNPRKRVNLAPLHFLLQMLEKKQGVSFSSLRFKNMFNFIVCCIRIRSQNISLQSR